MQYAYILAIHQWLISENREQAKFKKGKAISVTGHGGPYGF
jgi:hypothetical protein